MADEKPARLGTVIDYMHVDPEFSKPRSQTGYVFHQVPNTALGFDWLVISEDEVVEAVNEADVNHRVFLHYPCEDCRQALMSVPRFEGCVDPGRPEGPDDPEERCGRWTCAGFKQVGNRVIP